MDKMDEQVLVFPACYQKYIEGLPGLVTRTEENWHAFVETIIPSSRFMCRGDVEDDPSTSQIIPYVVVRRVEDGAILAYNRGDKGGEERLHNQWSIGFGGHVNECDAVSSEDGTVHTFTLLKCAEREILEEVKVDDYSGDLDAVAFLYITDTPVDQVHFGVVIECNLKAKEALPRATNEATQLKWVQPEELLEYELENWSAIVRDELLLKEN